MCVTSEPRAVIAIALTHQPTGPGEPPNAFARSAGMARMPAC